MNQSGKDQQQFKLDEVEGFDKFLVFSPAAILLTIGELFFLVGSPI